MPWQGREFAGPQGYISADTIIVSAEKPFNQPVFQRVKADDRQPTARAQRIHGLGEKGFQFFQFAVDENADALKTAGGRMLSDFVTGQYLGDQVRQLQSSGDGRLFPGTQDGAGDGAGKTFLAVFAQYSRYFRFGCDGQPR